MDLMGDIGLADQLTSAREENKVLRAKVQELTEKVKDLTLTNAQLLAEVEMYRQENVLGNFSNLALSKGVSKSQTTASENNTHGHATDHFISSGNGTYPHQLAANFANVHAGTNPLCCALDPTDTVLATGGANGSVCIVLWGTALAPDEQAADRALEHAARVTCSTAPVICLGFSREHCLIAAGCMDGSVFLIGYRVENDRTAGVAVVRAWLMDMVQKGTQGQEVQPEMARIKFTKYVKCLSFAPNTGLLACASADGTILVTKIQSIIQKSDSDDDDDDQVMEERNSWTDATNTTIMTTRGTVIVKHVKSLHLTHPVEALCFTNHGQTLCFYERDTCYLSYVDLVSNNDGHDDCDFKITRHSLNGDVTGGFDDHVSFAVMHLAPSPDGKYICAATDTSRNIILEVNTSNILRNLYGHKNDGYSTPRIAWSRNGQYILGNTQDEDSSSICVWDVASAKIVNKLQGHGGQVRDIFSSNVTDTVVTASFDKSVKVWLS